MPRWQLGVVAAFFVVYVVVILLTGEPLWLIPGAILALIVIGWSLTNRAATKRLEERHGDIESAMSSEEETLPAAHLLGAEDGRPMGDTPEAHDEINPRDIPPDSPARQAAEAQVAGEGDRETGGNVQGAQGGGEPSDSTAERA